MNTSYDESLHIQNIKARNFPWVMALQCLIFKAFLLKEKKSLIIECLPNSLKEFEREKGTGYSLLRKLPAQEMHRFFLLPSSTGCSKLAKSTLFRDIPSTFG